MLGPYAVVFVASVSRTFWDDAGASRWQTNACRKGITMTTPAFGPGWQQEQARHYRESNGEDGHIWNGVPTLLLTTTGKVSGETRTTC